MVYDHSHKHRKHEANPTLDPGTDSWPRLKRASTRLLSPQMLQLVSIQSHVLVGIHRSHTAWWKVGWSAHVAHSLSMHDCGPRCMAYTQENREEEMCGGGKSAHAAARTSASSSCRRRHVRRAMETVGVCTRERACATPSREAVGTSGLAQASHKYTHASNVSLSQARPSKGKRASRSGTCSVA